VTVQFSRRCFLKSSGLAFVGLGFVPQFLQRALAQSSNARGKILVVLFQRGAADSLSMVPPFGDPQYYAMRPTIALSPPGRGTDSAIRLNDTFGLHPALSALQRFWDNGNLAIVHGVGSPKPTRSHFDAQDFVEAGIPGRRTNDGWLNRALSASPEPKVSGFRAVAIQPNLPRSLLGPAPAMAISSLANFRLQTGRFSGQAEKGFESMYAAAVDASLRQSGGEAFRALREVQTAKLEQMPARNGAEYPNSPLGKRLADLARLIHADLGLEVGAIDCDGWDTHVNQGNAQGQLAGRLKDLGASIAAFATDLGEKMADVCLVTMTEFGRTVRENGNRGTDHGTGSAMFVLGGNVKGRQIYGRWMELKPSNLFEGRDLPVTTDYRTVLALALQGQLQVRDVDKVFPGLDLRSLPPLGIFG
jgi:uncharacterized protein (DUF1501 family)